jgi:hypothetical protein
MWWMTERKWFRCTDVGWMLDFLKGKASDRKLRLLAVHACRRLCELPIDEQSRNAVLVAERFADGEATIEELETARARVLKAMRGHRQAAIREGPSFGFPQMLAVACAAPVAFPPLSPSSPSDGPSSLFGRYDYFTNTIVEVIYVMGHYRIWQAGEPPREQTDEGTPSERIWNETVKQESAHQAGLLHCVFGPLPFRRVSGLAAWPSGHGGVVTQLAEVIYQERTFDRLPILADALEEAGCTNSELLAHCRAPGPHTRGCWPVDLLLGKE